MTIGVVICHKQILNSVSIKNDVGGTSEIPVGVYRVRVTKSWNDHEIGGRCVGVLLDPADIEKARKAGTTGHTPADYLKYKDVNPDLYDGAVKAAAEFDPSVVYFSASDFTEGSVPVVRTTDDSKLAAIKAVAAEQGITVIEIGASERLTLDDLRGVPVPAKKTPTPNIDSATVTARVISRLLRKAGFKMADTSDRFKWTEGYHVSRVGCSNLVSIDYHTEGHLLPRTVEDTRKRQEARRKLEEWLDQRGYKREPGAGCYIKCKRPD